MKSTAESNVDFSWNMRGTVTLGVGGGILVIGYQFTEEGSSLQTTFYLVGTILILIWGYKEFRNDDFSDPFFHSKKKDNKPVNLSLALYKDYAGITLNKYF